jgi:hypothetical protein
MPKLLAACAALAVTAMFALPGSAGATEQRADGIRNNDGIEVSSRHRHYRRYHYGPRYYYGYRRHWAPRYYYARPYYRPYYARPYYRPWPFF